MEMLIRAICLVGGYGVGLIQTAYIYGRIKGVDIRKYGSGNAGTTNALRVLGKKAGLIVFLGDFLKGIIACSLTHIILGQLGIGDAYMFVLYTGLGVVLGHNFPFYMQFKGGKGIAASGGMIVGLWDWRLVVILLAAFIISVVITRYVSVGSLTIMIGFFILYTVLFIIRAKPILPSSSPRRCVDTVASCGCLTARVSWRNMRSDWVWLVVTSWLVPSIRR